MYALFVKSSQHISIDHFNLQELRVFWCWDSLVEDDRDSRSQSTITTSTARIDGATASSLVWGDQILFKSDHLPSPLKNLYIEISCRSNPISTSTPTGFLRVADAGNGGNRVPNPPPRNPNPKPKAVPKAKTAQQEATKVV